MCADGTACARVRLNMHLKARCTCQVGHWQPCISSLHSVCSLLHSMHFLKHCVALPPAAFLLPIADGVPTPTPATPCTPLHPPAPHCTPAPCPLLLTHCPLANVQRHSSSLAPALAAAAEHSHWRLDSAAGAPSVEVAQNSQLAANTLHHQQQVIKELQDQVGPRGCWEERCDERCDGPHVPCYWLLAAACCLPAGLLTGLLGWPNFVYGRCCRCHTFMVLGTALPLLLRLPLQLVSWRCVQGSGAWHATTAALFRHELSPSTAAIEYLPRITPVPTTRLLRLGGRSQHVISPML
jgi:hypothetical protein